MVCTLFVNSYDYIDDIIVTLNVKVTNLKKVFFLNTRLPRIVVDTIKIGHTQKHIIIFSFSWQQCKIKV